MFIKLIKQFSDNPSTGWHYTSKPKTQLSDFFGFTVTYAVSDPALVGQKTHNIWINDKEAQASASTFPKVIMFDPSTKVKMTLEEYAVHQQDETSTSEESATF
tara:strand:- start:803 stop:1111 length:309 start_codon:yes stop_codon:yes gene_type:complete